MRLLQEGAERYIQRRPCCHSLPVRAGLHNFLHLQSSLQSRNKRGPGSCCRAQRQGPEGEAKSFLSRNQLAAAAGGAALLAAAIFTSNRETIADAFFGDGISTGVAAWGVGDALGGTLWSVSLYFCSPWQQLLIFLGRVDTERPSDWLLDVLARATGQDVKAADYSHPLALRAATVLFFAWCGTLIAWASSQALGDATWSLSTGLGSCLVAGIYEVGRPQRLTAKEASQLEDQYQDFARFADERLQPRGGCHESEIFAAFRQSMAKYRNADVLPDATLRQFIRNWAKQYYSPTAERTSNGFFKKISLKERVDPFSGKTQGVAVGSQKL